MAPKRKTNAKGPKSRKAKVEEVPDSVPEDSVESKADDEKKQEPIIAEVVVEAEEQEVNKKPENDTGDTEKEEKAEERAADKEELTEPPKTKRRGGRKKHENDTEKEEKAEEATEKEEDLKATEPTKRKRRGGKKEAENETEDAEEAEQKAVEKEEEVKATEPAKPKSRAGKKKEAPTVVPGTKRVTRANPGPKEVIQKEKEPSVAEDEPVSKTSSKAHIIIEHCKQCQSIKTRALKVEESLKTANPDLIISINPEKPRKGCFEIRDENGRIFVSLLNMPRPFKKLKDLNLDATVHDILEELN